MDGCTPSSASISVAATFSSARRTACLCLPDTNLSTVDSSEPLSSLRLAAEPASPYESVIIA